MPMFFQITLKKTPDFKKKFETVEQTDDLKKINNRFFNREPITFKKLSAGEDLAESGKGSTIYFAYANNGTPLAIVKELSIDDDIDREELNDEVLSLYEKYFNKTKNFTVPRLIGTAEFSSENKSTAYIIESVASGESINTLLKETTKQKNIDQSISYISLKKSIKSAAKAFAELHKMKKFSSYGSYYDHSYEGIKKGKFQGSYGLIHGDAHLGNIFYHPKTNKITFIDLSFMPKSLKGAPVGLDSGKFIFTLEALCSFYGLPGKETNELIDIYTKTYLKHNPSMNEGLLK